MRPLIIKYNKFIPFKGYFAITLFDYMLIRNENKNIEISERLLIHEGIHQRQSRDFYIGWFGYFIFYILYLLEWIIKCFISFFTGFKVKAYKSISFEQEAFNNEFDEEYLNTRKRLSWLKYIFKLVY